jgi:N-acetylglucosamine-6-sulfatase
MVLSTPSPHAPFTPAPQHSGAFPDQKAPRTPAFNHVEEDHEAKHWIVQRQPRPLNQTYIDQVDEVFRNRWRTLLSVDEMIDNVMTKLNTSGLLDNTVAIFTSDHGYHLGTFGLPLDKRMPYDTGTPKYSYTLLKGMTS